MFSPTVNRLLVLTSPVLSCYFSAFVIVAAVLFSSSEALNRSQCCYAQDCLNLSAPPTTQMAKSLVHLELCPTSSSSHWQPRNVLCFNISRLLFFRNRMIRKQQAPVQLHTPDTIFPQAGIQSAQKRAPHRSFKSPILSIQHTHRQCRRTVK